MKKCSVLSQREPKGPCPPKFLENIVILCFERCFSKQNSVIRLKLNILVYTDSIHCRILFMHFVIFRVWEGVMAQCTLRPYASVRDHVGHKVNLARLPLFWKVFSWNVQFSWVRYPNIDGWQFMVNTMTHKIVQQRIGAVRVV